jgi:DNA-nicking Smr family endonuclease
MSGSRGGKASRLSEGGPEAGDDAWRNYTGSVRPLKGRRPVAPAEKPVVTAPVVVKEAAPPAPVARARAVRPPADPVAIGAAPAGLDRANWERLRSGRMAATRTLDLHGHTAAAAHRALGRFLELAVADGVRCVEIVTGRGAGPEGGVLRRELPHWLNAPGLRGLILGAAHPHAANQGAVRVLLKRTRAR